MVRPDTNARYSATSRTYEYHILKLKDPFLTDSVWYVHGNLDIVMMNKASRLLLACSDFTSFSRLHSDNKTNICAIFHAYWKREGEQMIFTIKADRFLRNMVRAIVGTLVNVGKGKITIGDLNNIINARNRSAAGASAPAKGLYLTSITYPDEIFTY
jgi:tRNA pseudouridine38-40 synthase